jgi:hypothetical protein
MSDPDKSNISIITIHTEKDILRYGLDELSIQLCGEPAQRIFPIYVCFHHGKCRGFFIAPQRCVVEPTIHPEMRHLKEYQELVSSLVTEVKKMTGNPIFLLCARAEKLGEKLMRSFRLKKCASQAYEYCNEDDKA